MTYLVLFSKPSKNTSQSWNEIKLGPMRKAVARMTIELVKYARLVDPLGLMAEKNESRTITRNHGNIQGSNVY